MNYVYCLTNATLPGLVKIGMTTREPQQRLAEINRGAGVVGRWVLHKSWVVDGNPRHAESRAHKHFATTKVDGVGTEIFQTSPANVVAWAASQPDMYDTKAVMEAVAKERARLAEEARKKRIAEWAAAPLGRKLWMWLKTFAPLLAIVLYIGPIFGLISMGLLSIGGVPANFSFPIGVILFAAMLAKSAWSEVSQGA